MPVPSRSGGALPEAHAIGSISSSSISTATSTAAATNISISSVPRRSSYASVVSSPQQLHQLHQPLHPASTLDLTSHSRQYQPGNTNPPVLPSSLPSLPPDSLSPHILPIPARHTDADMQVSHGATSAGWRRSAVLPPYSRQFANIPEYAAGYPATTSLPASPDPSFFVPSYLRNSRYIARLESAQRAKQLAAQRESSSNAPSLSASSSHVNLHRMAPSHRGMTYDLVEKDLATDDKPQPLPSRWNDADKHHGLDLLNDGLEMRYIGLPHKADHEAASVRADHSMPRDGGYTITKRPVIAIGFSSSRSSLERLPGWDSESWAYHGDDGKAFVGESQGQGRPFGPTFAVNDTIGCGVAFNNLQTSSHVSFYPSVGIKRHPHMHIITNFGQQPFMFDIDDMVKKEKATLYSQVAETSTANLQPPLDETTLLQELVAQFLAQDGYYETARAFAEEVRQESESLENGQARLLCAYEQEEDLDATNRQSVEIRAAILEGDIDKALKHTNAYFSEVLQDNPHILFKLRCRKFLEMMCRCSDLSSTALKRGKSSNGVAYNNELFEQDMELDDHMHDGYSDADGMDTEEIDSTLKFQELLTEAVQYGQQLRMDYPSDGHGGDKQYLDDIFSLMAYSDPRSSVHGHYLDASGRVSVADELNSAILVSLGKSSSAAIETLYSQTEVLVNNLSEDGGVGAFINIRGDFL
ncbi:CTLH/CRA C-terminal to lish motif domain-containing protein [Talaromyces proteolyticus]|uniref:Protein FYV10 n=1 Tax=Talaromyces proteolyticus TaxID=1131652 RepID=A0AAD4PUP5_9EURO|nr:CTLH/CRA C-terminal to lish motif domain-containing protein [Talaromyces proteolyticus]KAH8692395.1 CTLH/CRA C-terminal to lish motif domain-containing protein [Talaromyces proteolyticus]